MAQSISDNVGNSYIAYAWAKILGINVYSAPSISNIWEDSGSEAELSDHIDWVFLNLQDQLRQGVPDTHYETALRAIKKFDRSGPKMVAFSLAANTVEGGSSDLAASLSPSSIRFFRSVSERCSSLGVRGEFTGSVLEKLGIDNFEVVGCPSYFESGPGRRVQAAEERMDRPTVGLTGRVTADDASASCFYLQGDEEWPIIDLLSLEDPDWTAAELAAALRDPRRRQVASAAAEGRAHFFNDFSAWKAHVAEHCVAVGGTRLHGAILALNAGVPAVVGNGDARAKEACAWFGIPWVPSLSEIGMETLKRIVDRADTANVNALYDLRFETFSKWLDMQGLRFSDHLDDFAPPHPLPFVPNKVVVSRLLKSYAQLAEWTTAEGARGEWIAYTPEVSCGGGPPLRYIAAGRFLVSGRSCAVNFRLEVIENGTAASPLTLRLPDGFRAAAPTALSGRETSGGRALQALVDGPALQIFDVDNAYPAYDGASITVSGVFEVAAAF